MPLTASALPAWLQYTQVIAVIVIALVGGWIAYKQFQLAEVKLKHDLYDRRFAVFEAARQLVYAVFKDVNASDQTIFAYKAGTSDAVFLLNDDIVAFLEELLKRATHLRALKETAAQSPTGSQQKVDSNNKANAELTWFAAQLDILIKKFQPFLVLESRKRLCF
jgi:uncharacterized membrane protein YraQ (UPF0718 family)